MTSSSPVVLFKRLENGNGINPPSPASVGAAGYDLCSAEDVEIAAGEYLAVSTGFALAIPAGFEGQVRPRSGLALKHGITVLNAPGTIDADYRGEVKVILVNHGKIDFQIRKNDRIAQIVFAAVHPAILEQVSVLPETARGSGGFGSTGIGVRKEG